MEAESEEVEEYEIPKDVFFVDDGYTFTSLYTFARRLSYTEWLRFRVHNALQNRGWSRFPQRQAAVLKEESSGQHGKYAKALLRCHAKGAMQRVVDTSLIRVGRVSTFMWIRWRSAIPFKHMVPGLASWATFLSAHSSQCGAGVHMVNHICNEVHPPEYCSV